jgi:oligopeptide transport system permease protein
MAHFGGWVDDLLMRIIEVINSLPSLLITILIMMILGNNLFALLVALSVTAWCSTARQTRGMIKQLKESEYVYAAEVLGASTLRIIIKHYVPNMLSILILEASVAIPQFIFTEAGLSFLGIGLKSPSISLGVLISLGQQTMDFYPSQLLYPCVVLCVIVMAFNLLGDGLRNALDPRLRQ